MVGYLEQIGCTVSAVEAGRIQVTVPSWRPDLAVAADLVEEVARLHGYQHIPSELPPAPVSSGLTLGPATASTRRRRAGRLRLRRGADISVPVAARARRDGSCHRMTHDATRLCSRTHSRTKSPSCARRCFRDCFATMRRNVGRGVDHLALFEMGLVYRPEPGDRHRHPPRPVVDRRPTDDELAAIAALLPRQPRRVAVVLSGERERSGWWGPGRVATWGDAVDAARAVADACGVTLKVVADDHAPWHPGRCAALMVDGTLVGHAGELHPEVVAAFGLPERTAAMELDLDLLAPATELRTPRRGSRPIRWPRRTWPWWSTGPSHRQTSRRRCCVAGVTWLSRCGSSTSTPANRSAPESARWRSLCACGPPTAR